MGIKEKVDAAIRAHLQWFVRLRMAVDEGSSEFNPLVVQTDNKCEFGRWLYSEFPAQQKSLPLCAEIKDLHAQFHTEAAKILRLALNNKKEEALKALAVGAVIRKNFRGSDSKITRFGKND
ncbi:MAG: CZB domain-containing protein [Candidatus Omnitrophica bacterium]|nr:CZB domain-containing protein [Candidatus Omnitrophota bacterium]